MLKVVNADGTGLRRLTDGMEPVWSPDGTKVAFARWEGESPGIYFIDEDDSNETLVFGWVAARRDISPVWSSDGSRNGEGKTNLQSPVQRAIDRVQ